jgi:hypothetical protein
MNLSDRLHDVALLEEVMSRPSAELVDDLRNGAQFPPTRWPFLSRGAVIT